MCRLFAYARVDIPLEPLGELLGGFRQLAEYGRVLPGSHPGHKSGWGIVGYRGGVLAFQHRAPEDAFLDPEYPQAVSDLISREPDAVLAHLRKATCGGPKIENTHPFTVGSWSMAHNGNAGAPDLACYAPIDGDCVGETDSERYFRLFLRNLDTTDAAPDSTQVVRALGETVHQIRSSSSTATSFSAVLTDGMRVYALRSFVLGRVQDAEGYYTLFLGHHKDMRHVAVCSERLAGGFDWELIPNGTVAIVDIATSSVNMQSIIR